MKEIKQYGSEKRILDAIQTATRPDNPHRLEACPNCDCASWRIAINEHEAIIICRGCGSHLYFELNPDEDCLDDED